MQLRAKSTQQLLPRLTWGWKVWCVAAGQSCWTHKFNRPAGLQNKSFKVREQTCEEVYAQLPAGCVPVSWAEVQLQTWSQLSDIRGVFRLLLWKHTHADSEDILVLMIGEVYLPMFVDNINLACPPPCVCTDGEVQPGSRQRQTGMIFGSHFGPL